MVGNITLGSGSVNTLPQPKKKYTYDDFTRDAETAGLSGSFSEADMEIAKNNPEAGKKILGYKVDYNNATTDEGRATANASANAVRRQAGQYHGGIDGLGTERAAEDAAQSGYTDLSRDEEYIEKRNELMAPREKFSYDLEKDKRWENQQRQFKSAMETAGSDALARIAAASGGRISSAAARAVAQTEAEYMGKMADKAAELEQDAYSRWLSEQQMKEQDLENLRAAAAEDYERQYNERAYKDSREDVNWEKDFNQRQYNDSRTDTQWEKDFNQRQYDDSRTDTQWEKDFNQRQYDDGRRWETAYTRAQLGDYDKLNEITDEVFKKEEEAAAPNMNFSEKNEAYRILGNKRETAKERSIVEDLLNRGYTPEQIKAFAGK